MAKPKTLFAAVPERAICDRRLAAIHFRILAAIALHDRMSGKRQKGAGCYASNKTLADACNVNYSNFSTAVCELGAWGYIEAAPHPISKRTRVYRVLYGGDQQPDSLPTGKQSPTDNTLPTGKRFDANCTDDALPKSNGNGETVCPLNSQTTEFIQQPNDKYIPLNGKRFSETVRYSAEAASLALRAAVGLRKQPDKNVGGFLAIIERELRDGVPLDAQTRHYIEQFVTNSADSTDPLYCQAERILETWGAAL
jgi:hypothetical protein